MSKMPIDNEDIAVDASYEEYEDSDDDKRTYISLTSDQSLASSVNRYRYENGRRYHGYRDGPHAYYAPNDDSYVNYESIVHHLWLLTLEDKLFLAPLENPQMVLDIGTGVGLWAIDMADCFPGAEIIGTDLSSIQSTTAPPNIRFEYDDANSEWTYPENSFDFVHVRGLTGCIRDWLALYQQAYKTLKPGAWFQHGEFSITTNADPKSDVHADKMYTKFSTLTMSCGEEEHTGMTFYTVERMRGYMEDAGFTNIVEKKFIWPIGPWPKDPHLKEMGRWGERNWTDGIENWVLALYTRFLGWKYTEVQSFITEFRKVIKDRKNHYYQTVCVVYGRKPGLEGKLGIEENLSLEATLKFEGGRSEGREGDEGDEEKAGE